MNYLKKQMKDKFNVHENSIYQYTLNFNFENSFSNFPLLHLEF